MKKLLSLWLACIMLTTLGAFDSGETAFALNKGTLNGTKDMPYAGTFDGDGHTINGVYVNDETIGYTELTVKYFICDKLSTLKLLFPVSEYTLTRL